MIACPYCGPNVMHMGSCPRVKAVEYYPNGILKRVEFHGPEQPQPIYIPSLPAMPTPYPYWPYGQLQSPVCGGTVTIAPLGETTGGSVCESLSAVGATTGIVGIYSSNSIN